MSLPSKVHGLHPVLECTAGSHLISGLPELVGKQLGEQVRIICLLRLSGGTVVCAVQLDTGDVAGLATTRSLF